MTKNEEIRYKSEEKRRHIILFAVILLIVGFVMIAIGTYAYYRTTLTGTVTGNIATWVFNANESNTTFTTITLAPTQTTKTLNSTMAPGTSGSFDIVLSTVGSNLAASYTITFSNFVNVPTNLQFYSDEDFTTVSDIRTTGYEITGNLNSNSSITKTIYWKWDFGSASSVTTDNSDANKDVSFDVTITGTQRNQ